MVNEAPGTGNVLAPLVTATVELPAVIQADLESVMVKEAVAGLQGFWATETVMVVVVKSPAGMVTEAESVAAAPVPVHVTPLGRRAVAMVQRSWALA